MKHTYITIALVVIALAGAGGLIWFTESGTDLSRSDTGGTPQDASATVATINNGETKITRGELDAQIQELAKNPQIQVPAEGEERTAFERLVLEQMVGGILLFNEAKRQGFVADDTAIDRELAAITAQYANVAAFEAALDTAQVSTEQLRENIARNLITNQYYEKVAAEHPVTASPEEIRAFFDTQVAPQDATAVFVDVDDEIKTHLEQQKTQEILAGIVDGLRASSTVEILL